MHNPAQTVSGKPETKGGVRPEPSALQPLLDMRERGTMPRGREIWLYLGFPPRRRNGLTIPFDALPSVQDCESVAGLDVVICYPGNLTRYGILWRLYCSLLAGRPRRLQLCDMDLEKLAFLKLGEKGGHHG